MAGILSSVLVGKWLDSTRQYKTPALLLTCISAAMITVMIVTLALIPEHSIVAPLHVVIYILLGFSQTAAMPVLVEFGVEITYPLDEILSAGVLFGGANTYAMVIVLGGGAILGDSPLKGDVMYVWVFILISLVLSAVALFTTKPNYLRRQHEVKMQAPPGR